ncbi:apicoplast pyruvate carrier 1-like isoform X2 [Apostichopus japonicus]|uniref:apicoplast pyruvate carrier 1-like isoform X2 n=1 Tax=Stichopus japonicus TaxID=307972 RepID=UPI003AB4D26C
MCNLPLKGIAAVVGGILITMTTGSYQCFGNLAPYLVSYIRKHGSPRNLNYLRGQNIFAVMMVTETIFMIINSYIERMTGFRLAVFIGTTTLTCGYFLTAYAINVHFYLVIFTYAIGTAIGLGMTFANIGVNAAKWFPGHEGMITGLATLGLGSSPLILSPLQHLLINPTNLMPNMTSSGSSDLYFDQESLLQRVPTYFTKKAVIFACLQIVGHCCLFEKKENEDSDVEREQGEEGDSQKDPLLPSATVSASVMHLFKSKSYWVMASSFCFSCASTVFILVNFKSYGQTIINDDSFLTMTWSISSISGGIGRMGGGFLLDVTSFKFVILINCVFQSAICLFLGLCELHKVPIIYCMLINCTALLQNCLITIFQVVGWRRFQYVERNLSIGLVFLGWCCGNLISVVFGYILMSVCDWQGTFTAFVCLPISGVVITWFLVDEDT